MKVVIGLPVRNGEMYLSRCLDSLLSQSHSDLQILLSDNGSIDGTLGIAEAYRRKDRRIHVFSGEKGGAYENWSFVLSQSDSPAFMWAAHDDWWHRDFIARGVRSLEQGHDFFMPSWWLGDIDSGWGWRLNENPYQEGTAWGFLERSLNYINLRHEIQKDILVYALFRREGLQRAVDEYIPSFSSTRDSSFSNMCSLFTLMLLKGEFSEEQLMKKQSVWHSSRPPFGHIKRSHGKTGRLSGLGKLKLYPRRSARDDGLSMTLDGLLEYTLHFPEISQTLLDLYRKQTSNPQSRYLVSDPVVLFEKGHVELRNFSSFLKARSQNSLLSRLYSPQNRR